MGAVGTLPAGNRPASAATGRARHGGSSAVAANCGDAGSGKPRGNGGHGKLGDRRKSAEEARALGGQRAAGGACELVGTRQPCAQRRARYRSGRRAHDDVGVPCVPTSGFGEGSKCAGVVGAANHPAGPEDEAYRSHGPMLAALRVSAEIDHYAGTRPFGPGQRRRSGGR